MGNENDNSASEDLGGTGRTEDFAVYLYRRQSFNFGLEI